MLQKEVTKNEVAIVVTIKRVLSDSKLADSFALMKVRHWLQFKNGITNLESDWLKFLGDINT